MLSLGNQLILFIQEHCLVVLEDGLFVAGGNTDEGEEAGRQYRKNAYLYSTATKSWKEIGEKLEVGRQKPVCGGIHGPFGNLLLYDVLSIFDHWRKMFHPFQGPKSLLQAV